MSKMFVWHRYVIQCNLFPYAFFFFPLAWELWTVVLSWFGIQWAMSRNVMELLIAWRGGRVGMRRKCVWNMIPLCDVDNLAREKSEMF